MLLITSIFPKGSGWNEDNYGPIRIPKKGDIIKIDSLILRDRECSL